jgi:hypothetical protein
MSAITKEFTKEQLQQIIETDHVQCGEASSLARIALASLEAVPVGEVSEQRDGLVMDGMVDLGGASAHRIIKGASKMKRLPLGTKFYTAPPAPVSVPAAMEMDDDFDSAFEHGKAVGWNAYRAAMLQGADGNSPVIPDGWVACSERMPEEGSKVIVFRPRASESNDPPVKTATYKGGREYYHGFDCYCEPTHWMPLPAAPQQED